MTSQQTAENYDKLTDHWNGDGVSRTNGIAQQQRANHRLDDFGRFYSIWHAPLAEHEAILNKPCAGLSQGGVLIFTSGGVDEPGEVAHPCLGQPLYHAALGIIRPLEIVAESGCVCRHLEYGPPPRTPPHCSKSRTVATTVHSRVASRLRPCHHLGPAASKGAFEGCSLPPKTGEKGTKNPGNGRF